MPCDKYDDGRGTRCNGSLHRGHLIQLQMFSVFRACFKYLKAHMRAHRNTRFAFAMHVHGDIYFFPSKQAFVTSGMDLVFILKRYLDNVLVK